MSSETGKGNRRQYAVIADFISLECGAHGARGFNLDCHDVQRLIGQELAQELGFIADVQFH